MKKLIECVPNFSEGRDLGIIDEITAEIRAVEGVSLLDVDPGASTNRTVVTLVGEPDAVIEAAFRAIGRAAELIDMTRHRGAHPRMGATDVCPLVPIAHVTDEEAIECAHRLARRVGEELRIPVYLYEKAATRPERKNLASIRAGEYEGFAEKIHLPEWQPDYGPQEFNPRAGQTAIGVRGFLIAYNVNLNTKSYRRANSVAFDVREKGRIKTRDGTPTGEKILGPDGKPLWEPGSCKAVKAIGWYVEEYGIAQVSMNLTDIASTPLHIAFDECVESARRRGLRVTGSEIVGLVPKKCLLEAGLYFLDKQNRSQGVCEEELIHIAVRSLGLDELKPFDPRETVSESGVEEEKKRLVDLTLRGFCNETASESPAPGGGSVAALCGALGASLGGMVANLSANTRGWDERVRELGSWAVEAQELKDELLRLIDDDSDAFSRVMDSHRLPRGTEAEQRARARAIQDATKNAALIPLRVAETALRCYPLLEKMATDGNPSSVSDAAVGSLCIHAAIEGAALNVLINLGGVEDAQLCADLRRRLGEIRTDSEARHSKIMPMVESKL